MALYQATAFFECNGYGWTETFYRDSQEVTDLAALADFDRNNIWLARQGMLSRHSKIVAQRASFVGIKNDSVLNYIQMPGPDIFDGEDPSTAVLCRLGNIDNTRRKNVFLRGGPDTLVVRGGVLENLPAWGNAFNAWQSIIIDKLYGWRGITTKTPLRITGYTETAENKVEVTIDAADTIPGAIGDKLVLIGQDVGVGTPSRLNGPNPYIKTAATKVTTVKKIAVFPFPGLGGKLISQQKDLFAIKNARLQKVDTRKAGKLSNLQAGRAPARPRG